MNYYITSYKKKVEPTTPKLKTEGITRNKLILKNKINIKKKPKRKQHYK